MNIITPYMYKYIQMLCYTQKPKYLEHSFFPVGKSCSQDALVFQLCSLQSWTVKVSPSFFLASTDTITESPNKYRFWANYCNMKCFGLYCNVGYRAYPFGFMSMKRHIPDKPKVNQQLYHMYKYQVGLEEFGTTLLPKYGQLPITCLSKILL